MVRPAVVPSTEQVVGLRVRLTTVRRLIYKVAPRGRYQVPSAAPISRRVGELAVVVCALVAGDLVTIVPDLPQPLRCVRRPPAPVY